MAWQLHERQFVAAVNNEARCRANLLAIAVAMHDYHAEYGSLPPRFVADENGKPAHSWRALILPYIDRRLASQYRFDEPWDGPRNRRLGSLCPAVFSCPADHHGAKQRGKTNYFVVSGDDTAFPDGKRVRFRDFVDTDDTILVVESVGADVDWLEPRDLNIATLQLNRTKFDGTGISSRHIHGCNVVRASGNTGLLRPSLSKDDLSTMLSIRAGAAQKCAARERQFVRAGEEDELDRAAFRQAREGNPGYRGPRPDNPGPAFGEGVPDE